MKESYYMGIDPGKDGAIVIIDRDYNIIERTVTPTFGDPPQYDKPRIMDILTLHSLKVVVLENPGMIFGISKTANASLSHCVGLFEGMVTALNIPILLVKPTKWQPVAWGETRRQYKTSSNNRKISDPKSTSKLAAKNFYPGVDWRKNERCTIDHSGIIDAVLIARYGVKTF